MLSDTIKRDVEVVCEEEPAEVFRILINQLRSGIAYGRLLKQRGQEQGPISLHDLTYLLALTLKAYARDCRLRGEIQQALNAEQEFETC